MRTNKQKFALGRHQSASSATPGGAYATPPSLLTTAGKRRRVFLVAFPIVALIAVAGLGVILQSKYAPDDSPETAVEAESSASDNQRVSYEVEPSTCTEIESFSSLSANDKPGAESREDAVRQESGFYLARTVAFETFESETEPGAVRLAAIDSEERVIRTYEIAQGNPSGYIAISYEGCAQ